MAPLRNLSLSPLPSRAATRSQLNSGASTATRTCASAGGVSGGSALLWSVLVCWGRKADLVPGPGRACPPAPAQACFFACR